MENLSLVAHRCWLMRCILARFAAFLIIAVSGCAFKNVDSLSLSRKRWESAVLSLECATDSLSLEDKQKIIVPVLKRWGKGEVSDEEMFRAMNLPSADLRYHGTAVFVASGEGRFLVTARHVVHDLLKANRDLSRTLALQTNGLAGPMARTEQDARETANRVIFETILIVPSLDEIQDRTKARPFLWNLGAVPYDVAPYTFSPPEIDLAVISLTNEKTLLGEKILDYLGKTGRRPIPLASVRSELPTEGEEVVAVGFPESVSVVGSLPSTPTAQRWKPYVMSLPAFTFGRVSMVHEKLPYFWCDLTVYPGNSGGPVFREGKWLGIVSAQATFAVDGAPTVRQRAPFAQVIRARLVRDLVLAQIEKDKRCAVLHRQNSQGVEKGASNGDKSQP